MSNLELHKLLAQADDSRQAHQYNEAIALYTAVLKQTESETADTEIRAMRLSALCEMGLLQRRSGQHDVALASYEQYHKEAKDSRQQVVALTQLGQQHSSMGQYDQALSMHKKALQLAETLNYANGRARAYLGIGGTYYYIGHYEEAISYLKKALSLFMQIEDSENVARTWNWLGILHAQLGELDKSIDAYNNALILVRTIGDLETSSVLNNLGETYQSLFDMEQALIYHREGLKLADKIALPAQSIDIQRNIGVELCYLGQSSEGIQYLEESLRLSQQYEQKDIAMQTLYSLAQVQIENEQLVRAKIYIDQLDMMLTEGELRGYHAKAMYLLGLYYRANGDGEKAEQLWQQVLFLAHETSQRNLLWRVHAALANISNNPGLVKTHNRIAAEVIDQIIYPIEDDLLCQKFRNAPPVKAVLDQIV